MQPQEFYIPTTWRIKGTAEQVYDVLSNGDHKWAMQRGLEGLTRELARRAAA
jgi:hypothetical protein